MRKLLCLFFLFPILLIAQPGNYWTNSFNSEASLLSGAVVGSNAGITAIFYNPAGISNVEQSRIDLNASLFNLEYKRYNNPLGDNTLMENWVFRVFPRFVSYLFQSKKFDNTSFQVAIFNRNSAKTDIYNRVQLTNTDLANQSFVEEYTGLFDLISKYDDYWGSFGVSHRLNEDWSVGLSMSVSIQSIEYLRSATANVLPLDQQLSDHSSYKTSNWQAAEKVKAYNWRMIGKIGVQYKKGNWSTGLNITLPSLRLFGTADVNKTVSQSNIYYQEGFIDDYYKNEYPQSVYFKMQDPFSASFGLSYKSNKNESEYFFTAEYFAGIKEYNSIDPTRKTSKNSVLGTEYSAYTFGNRQIINFALGYKLMLSKSLGFLVGFRTDFNPYIMAYNEKYWESSSFENLNVDLFHLTGGVHFDFKQSSFVVGLQHSYGQKNNQAEFINFSDPISYDEESQLALQGPRKNNMRYDYGSLGIYLSFSVSF